MHPKSTCLVLVFVRSLRLRCATKGTSLFLSLLPIAQCMLTPSSNASACFVVIACTQPTLCLLLCYRRALCRVAITVRVRDSTVVSLSDRANRNECASTRAHTNGGTSGSRRRQRSENEKGCKKRSVSKTRDGKETKGKENARGNREEKKERVTGLLQFALLS